MGIEGPQRPKESIPVREGLPWLRYADKGALLAGALLASCSPGLESSNATRAEASHVHTWEEVEKLPTPGLQSFLLDMNKHARDNSRAGGHETARVYVRNRDGEELVLDAEDIASSNQVFTDKQVISKAVLESGSVMMFCHTHPFDAPVPGAEQKPYVFVPSTGDLEVLIHQVDSEILTFGAVPGDGTYERVFALMASRIENCVATPGRGYWRMRVTDTETAMAWLKREQEDPMYWEEMDKLLSPLEHDRFFDTYDIAGRYAQARESKDANRLAVLFEHDLLNNTLVGEARERAHRFMDAYNGYRSRREYNFDDPRTSLLSHIKAKTLDTPDRAATEQEYLLFQSEIQHLYGIEVTWVDLKE